MGHLVEQFFLKNQKNSASEGRRNLQASSSGTATACSVPDFTVRSRDRPRGLCVAQSRSPRAKPLPSTHGPCCPSSSTPHSPGGGASHRGLVVQNLPLSQDKPAPLPRLSPAPHFQQVA